MKILGLLVTLGWRRLRAGVRAGEDVLQRSGLGGSWNQIKQHLPKAHLAGPSFSISLAQTAVNEVYP